MQKSHALLRVFWGALIVNVCMVVVMIRIHAEPFCVLTDPLSWLGKLITTGGFVNTGGAVLFSATMLFNAYKWQQTLPVLMQYKVGRYRGVQVLGYVVLVGFLLMAFPCDAFVVMHSLGGGFVVGGLWAFTTGAFYLLRWRLGARLHFGLQLALHACALYCGYHFAFNTPLKGFSQRPLLIAMIAGAGYCLHKSRGVSISGVR